LTFFEKHTTRVSILLSKTTLKIAWKRKSTDAGKTAKIPGLTSLARDLCEKEKKKLTGGVWEVDSQNTKLETTLIIIY